MSCAKPYGPGISIPIDVTLNDPRGGLLQVELVLPCQSLGLHGKELAGKGQGGVGVRAAKGEDHAEGVGAQLVLLLGVGPQEWLPRPRIL